MTQDWNFLLQRLQKSADDLGDARAEAMAAAEGTVVAPLAELGLLRASGPEAADFLHRLLSNDIEHLPTDGLCRAAFCTPKGRMLADFLIWREGEDYLLQTGADLLPGMLKKLSMYILRSKVKLADISAERALIGISGPEAADLLMALGGTPPPLPMGRIDCLGGSLLALDGRRLLLALPLAEAPAVWQQLASRAQPVGSGAWRWLEIAAGIPRISLSTQEEFVPQMVNLDKVSGISFKKGCYPGQEIVARTHYLGKVKRRMFRAHIEGQALPPGTPVFSPETGDQACGAVVSLAPAPTGGHELLAVIQISCAQAGNIHLGAPDGPLATLLPLPYALD
ncbi:YgfZ/GcvT domain-containing protein [Denitratisoma oestradiolicum]|uniref:GCVT N-terminal domain-containing protein n=1 Tax=Denitratisoma oestradiolicum TaxID=311182 RepID=A0A6S6Y111_9PROT|nr:folate-binding protein YgfZ [Denitratisoma oestradiolicum]TWO81989.1 hypothetical protein CBW56_00680 [Denitratisoma oestradiolicum]CAB1368901.1 conserved protein of unknown function [Denitratisoma oestradiolicum]